jgi:hypothetical protein
MAALFARIGDLCDIPVVKGASLGSRTPMAKSISRQQSIGERGRHLFSERVLAAGLSFHPTGPLDAGIDGFIELRDPRTGEVRAQYVMAQLKTREDGAFSQETESSFSWTVDQRDLEYWLGSNAPVILVVVRLSDRLMVWKSIRDYFATSEKKASRKIFFDKREDALHPRRQRSPHWSRHSAGPARWSRPCGPRSSLTPTCSERCSNRRLISLRQTSHMRKFVKRRFRSRILPRSIGYFTESESSLSATPKVRSFRISWIQAPQIPLSLLKTPSN